MAQTRRFILFELNEVPTRVVEHYAERHPSSAFATVLRRGLQFETVTPDEGHLSPWITWPTLHRGVPSTEHQIIALGQDVAEVDRRYPPVWALLTDAGKRVGLFGSLHSYPLPPNVDAYAFYVPDTFAAGSEAAPRELSAFQDFNLRMVDRSGRNVSTGLPAREALGFLRHAVGSGLKAGTVAKAARQVATERVLRHRVGRRRTLQSLIAFDLFLEQLTKTLPDAAFFFTNHVASSMHRYWPATFTDDYHETKWSEGWVRRFAGELDYTMGEADRMLGAFMEFADDHPDYVVLVTGSMGQAAVDSADKQTKTEVLVRDMGKFMSCLGCSGWRRRRTMEPTYTLAFDDEAAAGRLVEACANVKIAGDPLNHRRVDSSTVEILLGQKNVPDEELTITIGNRVFEPEEAGLANVTIDDEVGSAAYHIPEGMLLLYDPQSEEGRRHGTPVLTTRIAPTLLALQGVARPGYMKQAIGQILDTALNAGSRRQGASQHGRRGEADLASA
jgi:hypothetical protein